MIAAQLLAAKKEAFDLYSTRSLGREAVIAIHSEGEAEFAAFGQGYPPRFVDRYSRTSRFIKSKPQSIGNWRASFYSSA